MIEIIETENENMGNTKEKRTKRGRVIKKPNRYWHIADL